MAWRIGDHVVRGEIDNRLPGLIKGTLYLNGLKAPLQLELEGDPERDLAGRHLTFRNLHCAPPIEPQSLDLEQSGEAGCMTASRMVRIPTIPETEVSRCLREGLAIPTRWAESLHLEWFASNGPILLEGASFACELSAPRWRRTEEEFQWVARCRDQAAAPAFCDTPPADEDDSGLPDTPFEPHRWRIPIVDSNGQPVDEARPHPTVHRAVDLLLSLIFESRSRRHYTADSLENYPIEMMLEACSRATLRLARAIADAGDTWGTEGLASIARQIQQARWSLAEAAENARLAAHWGSADRAWLARVRSDCAALRRELRTLALAYSTSTRASTRPRAAAPPCARPAEPASAAAPPGSACSPNPATTSEAPGTEVRREAEPTNNAPASQEKTA